MTNTYTTNNGKYQYRTINTENLEITGAHCTIATLSKRDAIQLAQALISAATDETEDTVRFELEMNTPIQLGDAPEVFVSVGHSGYVKPQLHWATIEGHLFFELTEEWLDTNVGDEK